MSFDLTAELPGLPRYLPAELRTAARATQLLRQLNDLELGGGAGVCLGVSGFLSYSLLEEEIGHRLANGIYRDSDGEHPHWWIETDSGWILDASRGQFDLDGDGLPSVVTRMDRSYSLRDSWDPGHSSSELIEAELNRSFADPLEARDYLQRCFELWRLAEDLITG